MREQKIGVELPPIPNKRYFTIGEVGKLCEVKPHVLRYWEQEFSQLSPVKRAGNRRYYQQHDVQLVRRIRNLLYDQGFTIGGARQHLDTDDAPQTHTNTGQPDQLKQLRLELESILDILKGSNE